MAVAGWLVEGSETTERDLEVAQTVSAMVLLNNGRDPAALLMTLVTATQAIVPPALTFACALVPDHEQWLVSFHSTPHSHSPQEPTTPDRVIAYAKELAQQPTPFELPHEIRLDGTPFVDLVPQLQPAGRGQLFPLGPDFSAGFVFVSTPKAELSVGRRRLITMLCNHAASVLSLARARQHERHSDALYKTVMELAYQQESKSVLEALVKRARELLAADAAWIMLVDELAPGRVNYHVGTGITHPDFVHAYGYVDRDLVGTAAERRQVAYFRDIFDYPDRGEFSKKEGLRSELCAPIYSPEKLLGVLIVGNRSVTQFTREEKRMLLGLANAAALAIENARLYADLRASNEELRSVNELLVAQTDALKRTLAVREQLTAMVLEQRGLAAIIDALANLLDSSVLLLDHLCRPLALSSNLRPDGPELRMVEGPDLRQMLQKAKSGSGLSQLSLQDDEQRVSAVLARIETGTDVPAYLVVLGNKRRLDHIDLGAADYALTVIGLEMMKERTEAEVEARLSGDFFNALLSGRFTDDAVATRRASYIGYEIAGINTLLGLAVDGSSDLPEDDPSQHRLYEGVRQLASRGKAVYPVFVRDGATFLAIAVPPGGRAIDLDRLCRRVRDQLKWYLPERTVSIAVGGSHQGVAGFCQSYSEARHVLDVIRVTRVRGANLKFQNLRVWQILGKVPNRGDLERFVDQVLGKLIEHDRLKSASLVNTVQAFAQNNYNYRVTAEKLFLHLNTLRYRIERAAAISGIDFDRSDRRLELQLALEILDLIGRPTTLKTDAVSQTEPVSATRKATRAGGQARWQ